MELWTEATLNAMKAEAERELSNRVPHIFKRFTVSVVQGENIITLPSNVQEVISFYYKGKKVDSKLFLEGHQLVNNALGTNEGDPRYFIRMYQGTLKLMVYPRFPETITADDTALTNYNQYKEKVVISAWVMSDPTDDNYRTPAFFLRRLIKHYVNMRAYMSEGKGQRVRAAGYYAQKWDLAIQHLFNAKQALYKFVMKGMMPTKIGPLKPSRPVLPPQFGRRVK